nr:hypothetical protein CFP56_32067 [Quercus suber]
MATSLLALLRAPRLQFSSSSTLLITTTSFSVSSLQAYASEAEVLINEGVSAAEVVDDDAVEPWHEFKLTT